VGYSFELIKRGPLELSLEVDRDLRIEISTGFNSDDSYNFSTSIQVTEEDLSNLIDNLLRIKRDLKLSLVCDPCGAINGPASKYCNVCDFKLGE
jgi:hypothetical protein